MPTPINRRQPVTDWRFVKRAVLTIASVQIAGLLVIGAVVWHTGGRLEPSTAMASQAPR
jgi:hypothetical protein